jgi:hypothetical protein
MFGVRARLPYTWSVRSVSTTISTTLGPSGGAPRCANASSSKPARAPTDAPAAPRNSRRVLVGVTRPE